MYSYNGEKTKVKWYGNKLPDDYNVMVCSIFGKGIYVLPRMSVCSKYYVPFKLKDAESFLSYYNAEYSKHISNALSTYIKIDKIDNKIISSLGVKLDCLKIKYPNYLKELSISGYSRFQDDMDRIFQGRISN